MLFFDTWSRVLLVTPVRQSLLMRLRMWSTKCRRDASGMTISGHGLQKAGSIKATICLMESWMKRGFFQNSKSDSKSIASKDIVQADRRPEAVVSSPNNQQEPSPLTKIKIPCVPNDFGEFVQFPAIGDLPAARGEPINTTVVKLPFHGTPYTVSLLYPGAKEAIEAVPGFPSPYMPLFRCIIALVMCQALERACLH